MKKSRYTEEQIIGILKQHEAGVKTADLCREHGISAATFYGWKSKYGGMDVSEAQRLKALEDENRRLKLLVAELSLHGEALKRGRKDFVCAGQACCGEACGKNALPHPGRVWDGLATNQELANSATVKCPTSISVIFNGRHASASFDTAAGPEWCRIAASIDYWRRSMLSKPAHDR